MTGKMIDYAIRLFYVLLGAVAVIISVLIAVAMAVLLLVIIHLCGAYLGWWAA